MTVSPLRRSAAIPGDRLPPLVAADYASEQARLQRLTAREIELAGRERECDRREATLLEREHRLALDRNQPQRSARAVPENTAERTKALADAIVRQGKIRRSELQETPKVTGMAAEILRCGALARGTLVEDKEPQTEAERIAQLVILAGKKRRAEID
jgi:hypothetical protein